MRIWVKDWARWLGVVLERRETRKGWSKLSSAVSSMVMTRPDWRGMNWQRAERRVVLPEPVSPATRIRFLARMADFRRWRPGRSKVWARMRWAAVSGFWGDFRMVMQVPGV